MTSGEFLDSLDAKLRALAVTYGRSTSAMPPGFAVPAADAALDAVALCQRRSWREWAMASVQDGAAAADAYRQAREGAQRPAGAIAAAAAEDEWEDAGRWVSGELSAVASLVRAEAAPPARSPWEIAVASWVLNRNATMRKGT